MKLYRGGTILYIAESGKVRTVTSEATIKKVMRSLQSEFPDNHLTDFTSEELTWFCLNRHDGKDGLAAPATIKQRRAYLTSTFEWWTWKKLLKFNPALELKFTVDPGHGKVRQGEWLDEAAVKEIYRAFDGKDPIQQRNRLIFLFGVTTGLRLFELAELTWDSFPADLSSIRFIGKGRKPADVKLPQQLQEELGAWKRHAWMGAKAVFPTVKEAFDFGALKRRQSLNWDRPLGTDGIRFVIRNAGKKAGVKLNPHDLRRSFAGILEDKGISVKDIQLAMRHSNIGTTDAYLKNNPARAHRVTGGFSLEL